MFLLPLLIARLTGVVVEAKLVASTYERKSSAMLVFEAAVRELVAAGKPEAVASVLLTPRSKTTQRRRSGEPVFVYLVLPEIAGTTLATT